MPRLSDKVLNAKIAAVARFFDGGTVEIYAGALPPSPGSNGGVAPLATLTFASPAFGPPEAGVVTSMPIAADEDANGTGEATWFRVRADDGTFVMDGLIGPELTINAMNVQKHAVVSCSGISMSERNGSVGLGL
jgi:hypothetical protein